MNSTANTITIEVDYTTHKYMENWDRETSLHCPECGKKDVWIEQGEGDFYVGPSHLCVACGSGFTLQCGGNDNVQDQQRLQAIRQAKDSK